jgi:hypothetical protein
VQPHRARRERLAVAAEALADRGRVERLAAAAPEQTQPIERHRNAQQQRIAGARERLAHRRAHPRGAAAATRARSWTPFHAVQTMPTLGVGSSSTETCMPAP